MMSMLHLILVIGHSGCLEEDCSGLRGEHRVETNCQDGQSQKGRVTIEDWTYESGDYEGRDRPTCAVVDGPRFGLPKELWESEDEQYLEGEVDGRVRTCNGARFGGDLILACSELGEPVCGAILRPVE